MENITEIQGECPALTDRLLELPHPPFRHHGIISSVYFADLPELSTCITGNTHGQIAREWDLKERLIVENCA